MAVGEAVRRTRARPASAGRWRGGRWTDYLFVLPAVLFVGAVIVYPLVYTLRLSVQRVRIGNVLSGQAPFVGIDNYVAALTGSHLWHSLFTSLIYTGCSIATALVLGFAFALFFNRTFPGSGIMRAILLAAWVLPSVVIGTVWRWMLDGESGIVNAALQALGLINAPIFWRTDADTALIAVMVATVWVSIPFSMILLLAGLQGIPESLYEAAKVDGANYWRRFRHVTLPMMRPVFFTVVLLSFIYTFKTFDTVYTMTRGGPGDATSILPIRAYNLAFEFFRFSAGATVTIMLLLISLVAALIYSRLTRAERR